MKSKDLIMHIDNLAEIAHRLHGLCALLDTVHRTAGTVELSDEALSGICDLLDCICRDFQADIDFAELYAEKMEDTA